MEDCIHENIEVESDLDNDHIDKVVYVHYLCRTAIKQVCILYTYKRLYGKNKTNNRAIAAYER